MANVYQVYLFSDYAIIEEKQSNGTLIKRWQCMLSEAKKFIRSHSMGFMIDTGDYITYIS